MKTETIDFKEFIKNREPQREIPKEKNQPTTLYSLSPLAFIDINFLLIGSGIVLIAVIEKALADSGMVTAAAIISGIFHIGFPIAALGSIYYVIASSSFL